MRRRCFVPTGALVVVIGLLSFGLVSLTGQGPQAGAGGWTPPRTPDGQPDLQGVWNYSTITPLERPQEFAGKAVLSEQEAAEFEREANERNNKDRRDQAPGSVTDVGRAYNEFWWDRGTKLAAGRTSLVVDPPDGRIPPLTPDAIKKAAARAASRGVVTAAAGGEDGTRGGVDGRGGRADHPEDRGLDERCITRSAPRLPGAYNNNYQITQGTGYVAILQEMNYEVRIIPIDGRPHLPGHVRQWLGDSRGRWEGNTLVVETKNFTHKRNFRGSGETFQLIERFTRVGPDTLQYEFTVDDPTTWTKPWTVSFPMTKSQEPIYEYACHEGNYGMTNLLAGERTLEKARSGSR